MAIALAAGALQGVLIGLGGNPIVVTLGAAGLFFGIGSWWSDNLVVSFRRPHGAEWLGTGSFLGLPNITVAFILIAHRRGTGAAPYELWPAGLSGRCKPRCR